jgi:fatty acid desaturase
MNLAEIQDPDHRQIVAALPQAERTRLTERTNRHAFIRFALHFGAALALGGAIIAHVPAWPVLLLPQGILIIFLFTALHETIHDTAFRSGLLNRIIGNICGFLVLVPPIWFRYFHLAHHRHTHDPDNDPELMSPKPETVWQYAKYLSGIPLWIAMAKVIVGAALGRASDPYIPEKGRLKVVREARIYLAFYALLIAGSAALQTTALVWAWVVPALLGQPFLRAYLLAEHARCPHVANMLENTRTTFTNAVVRFIAWNMPFHAEHHAYPSVPFHRLPDFHGVVREHLKTTERGYAQFHGKYASALR